MSKREMESSGRQAGTLDWGELHRRLEAIQQTIDHGWTLTREEKKKALHSRAEALAKELPRRESAEQALEVLEFMLAQEHYGIELNHVREVYPLKDLTPLPGTPNFILGLTNVRGQVLSIIDIKKLFGLPDKGLTDFNKIVIIHAPRMELGILADAVLGLKPLPLSEIQSSLPTLKGIREDFLRGVSREGIVVLDVTKLLSVQLKGWPGNG